MWYRFKIRANIGVGVGVGGRGQTGRNLRTGAEVSGVWVCAVSAQACTGGKLNLLRAAGIPDIA